METFHQVFLALGQWVLFFPDYPHFDDFGWENTCFFRTDKVDSLAPVSLTSQKIIAQQTPGIRRSWLEKISCEIQAFHLIQNVIKNFGSSAACSHFPEMTLFNWVWGTYGFVSCSYRPQRLWSFIPSFFWLNKTTCCTVGNPQRQFKGTVHDTFCNMVCHFSLPDKLSWLEMVVAWGCIQLSCLG